MQASVCQQACDEIVKLKLSRIPYATVLAQTIVYGIR